LNFTARSLTQPSDRPEQAALSRPAWTLDGDELACANFKGNAADGFDTYVTAGVRNENIV
jgi:hypothetical protein